MNKGHEPMTAQTQTHLVFLFLIHNLHYPAVYTRQQIETDTYMGEKLIPSRFRFFHTHT